jgi:hypothetical protein
VYTLSYRIDWWLLEELELLSGSEFPKVVGPDILEVAPNQTRNILTTRVCERPLRVSHNDLIA